MYTYLIAASFALLSCAQPGESDTSKLFTKTDAEKILGEPAHLTDSASSVRQDTIEYRCTYTADTPDLKTGKRGNIYFMWDQYADTSIAKSLYSFFKKANETHEGVKVIHDLGDEAYFHSDGENFYFILVRKGLKMIRMKVDKITSNTSVAEFNRVARKIIKAL